MNVISLAQFPAVAAAVAAAAAEAAAGDTNILSLYVKLKIRLHGQTVGLRYSNTA